ncbi:MAG: DNA mismatch repair endonuclease MutL [Deltaproteobacteria bacterium]|nr:DNA mismatch repair endonuclease MutL [Deltaproteobacteria bacterium]
MTATIRILSEDLCNRIAAGEVVERPASVVKELVENSLDAGAASIVVTIENGGRTLIRVEDDGCGMSRDDLFLCLERHATSKIESDADLFRLRTLGFRGEALPSIAAVSRTTLKSRIAGSDEGWELQLEGGAVRKSQGAGMPPGTDIEVRQLFFNVPARRKFLKSDATEFAHCADFIGHIALAFPQVRMVLRHNGRVILNLPRQNDPFLRARDVLGDVFGDALPVERRAGDLCLTGFAAPPQQNRSLADGIHAYVNRRFVRDRLIQHAVLEGYRQLLPKQRYPLAVLFLDLPPEQVDVNVHPAKREVRFRNQREIHDFIATTLLDLWRAPREEEAPSPGAGASEAVPSLTEEQAFDLFARENAPNVPDGPPESAPQAADAAPSIESVLVKGESRLAFPPPASETAAVPETRPADGFAERPVSFRTERFSPPAGPPEPSRHPALFTRGRFGAMRILGQYHETYIVCQDEGDLVLVDQHAAHERIGFERLKAEFHSHAVASQTLLFPVVMDLDFGERDMLEKRKSDMERLGFDLELYGGRSCALRAIPAFLDPGEAENALRDVAAELLALDASSALEDALDKVLIRMACHGMIRANQTLSMQEMRELLRQLDEIDFESHCPHGRPVVQRFSRRAIEAMFQRT